MGLAIIEFVMTVEETFGIDIPDADAQTIWTPRDLIDYITRKLSMRDPRTCHTQHAFYRIRRAAISCATAPCGRVRPSTQWKDLLPGFSLRRNWNRVQAALGFSLRVPRLSQTLAETAQIAVATAPTQFIVPGGGWSRDRVAAIVNDLIVQVLKVREFTEDSRFISDMGVD